MLITSRPHKLLLSYAIFVVLSHRFLPGRMFSSDIVLLLIETDGGMNTY